MDDVSADINRISVYNSQYEAGSAEYGNFLNYYSFYPPEERIQLIPLNLFSLNSENIVCLDVGCNSGELTCALYNKFVTSGSSDAARRNCKFLAVDIDSLLIDRAKSASTNVNINFVCVDVLSNNFKSLCSSFLGANFKTKFDFVFLFSVTMWIHLNNGDEGLKTFLKNISQKANILVLEPQPWKCYKTAVRRRRRAKKCIFQYWNELKFRETIEDDLNRIICDECSFELMWRSKMTRWERKISLYKNSET